EQKPLRPPGEELGSIAAAQLGAPTSPGAPEAIASPGPLEVAPGQPAKPGQAFWFKVNAELIVYGATEPDAVVTIGGRQIRLRPDGTFSYRFALPDGTYQLPIQAVAVHGDQRRADLSFYRGTRYEGEVGAQAQKPGLQAPAPQNVT
ncbi:MAG TPA: hypothetical protein VN673_09255, partial [Clostridia bacterium]|nr:hypothetical protein [Clostridia bacterium]